MGAREEIVFAGDGWSSAALGAAFERHGAVIVKGVVDLDLLERFTATVCRLLRARLESLGCADAEGDDIDALFERLVALQPRSVGEVFVVVRHLIEHAELIFAPRLKAVVAALMPDSIVQAVPDACGIRIDGPTSGRDFGWHHDYCYLAMSQRGITGWLPMMPMTDDMGYMRVVLGSHKTITPVIFREEIARGGNFRGNRAYELHLDDAQLEAESVVLDDVQPGDVVFIHTLLLHRSGTNVAQRARWTVLPRYGDALDPAVVARGWKAIGAPAERLFNTLHPELVQIHAVGSR